MVERVDLRQEKETLLMTLYLRACDSQARHPVLGDPYAQGLVERIDYDFDRLARLRGNTALISSRARQLDTWTAAFLAAHPDGLMRRRLYDLPDGVTMIATSVTDPAWWDQVPTDRPTLVLAEGLFMYLPGAQVHQLIDRVIAHLPEGRLAFDGVARGVTAAARLQPAFRWADTGFDWALTSPQTLADQHPGLRLVDEVSRVD